MTATFKLISLKGRHPVRTYQEVNPMLLWVEVCTHFKDHHPDRVDIRALGGELFQGRPGEPKLLWVH